jgi:hypothetical protein
LAAVLILSRGEELIGRRKLFVFIDLKGIGLDRFEWRKGLGG